MVVVKVLGLLLWGTLLLSGCSRSDSPPQRGEVAPPFSLLSLEGRKVQFPDSFGSRPIILTFWADWCPACARELPLFEQLLQQQGRDRL
ncbi:MAG: TlpA family protein disulfide reductase, partial [Gammaproteobacteria bacterium]|nr:TlpA family protein disulfide reductase [Gammaproteobacteria bacterium]